MFDLTSEQGYLWRRELQSPRVWLRRMAEWLPQRLALHGERVRALLGREDSQVGLAHTRGLAFYWWTLTTWQCTGSLAYHGHLVHFIWSFCWASNSWATCWHSEEYPRPYWRWGTHLVRSIIHMRYWGLGFATRLGRYRQDSLILINY